MTIVETAPKNSANYKLFCDFPGILYINDPYFIDAPLQVSSGIATRFFVAIKQGQCIGRIAAFLNPQLVYEDYQCGLAGFFECVDDLSVSKMLFKAVQTHLKAAWNCNYCIGPLNGSTWYKYRLTDPDPSPPFFLDNYHKSYYSNHFTENSFIPIGKYNSSRTSHLTVSKGRLKRFEKHFMEKGLRIRTINIDQYGSEIKKIYSICRSAFKRNFLYTPISERETVTLYGSAKGIINPEYVLICEDMQKRPIAFIFCVPDLFDKQRKTLIIKSLAVLPESRSRGLGALLVEKIHLKAFEHGFERIIHALMFADNVSNNIAASDSEVFRTYTLYGKKV